MDLGSAQSNGVGGSTTGTFFPWHQPKLVGSGTGLTDISRGPQISIFPKPAVGDLLIIFAGQPGGSPTITAPGAGWDNALTSGSLVDTRVAGIIEQSVWYHVYTQTESDQQVTVWNLVIYSAQTTGTAVILQIRGADATKIGPTYQEAKGSTPVTPHVLPGFKPPGPAALVVAGITPDGNETYTTPSGWALAQSVTGSPNIWTGYYGSQVPTGTTVAGTNITPSASDEYVADTLTIGAAAPGPTLGGQVDGVGGTQAVFNGLQALAASSAGAGTVTGPLVVTRSTAGESDGISTVSGTSMQKVVGLSASSAGAATTSTPNMFVTRPLAGEADGSVSQSAMLGVNRPMSGSVAGASTDTGVMADAIGLVGVTAGVCTVSAPVLVTVRIFAAVVAGVATDSALMNRAALLSAAQSNGTSSVSASFGAPVFMSGESDGAVGSTSALNVVRPLAATTPGVGTITGSMQVAHALGSQAAGVSTDQSTLAVNRGLAGEVDALGTITAMLSLVRVLGVARADGVGTTSPDCTFVVVHALVGTSSGVATAQAIVMVSSRELSGAAHGAGGMGSETLTRLVALTGTSRGQATATASLQRGAVLLQGRIDGVGVTDSPLSVNRALTGASVGASTDVGVVRNVVGVSGTARGTSTVVAGTITVVRRLKGLATGQSGSSAVFGVASSFFMGKTKGSSTVTGVIRKTDGLGGTSKGAATVHTARMRSTVALGGMSGGLGGASGQPLLLLDGSVYTWTSDGWRLQTLSATPITIWNGTTWDENPYVWTGTKWQPLNPQWVDGAQREDAMMGG